MVKKRLLFLGVILSFALFFNFSSAKAEEILDFHSDITIQKDSSFLVKETIIYDFGNLQKHGIYRDIPKGNSSIKIQKVLDENGVPYKYSLSNQGDNFQVKIGSADFTISGVHTYNIFYSVSGGLRFFDDHDELYQNITGNGWQVPIKNSSVKVILPQSISENNLQFACFTGVYGLKDSQCDWQVDSSQNIIFESTKSFLAGEGLTVVLGWPKGVVEKPYYNPLIIWLQKFWPIFIPILVFIFLFRKWQKDGKDLPLKGPVVAQYEPPENLRPAQVGVIMNQTLKPVDISATIVDWAVNGYIKIKEIENKILGIFKQKDYELVILKNLEPNSTAYEKKVWTDIFGQGKESTKISTIKKEFYRDFSAVKKQISAEITSLGYFTSDPSKIFKIPFNYRIAKLYVMLFLIIFLPGWATMSGILKTNLIVFAISLFFVPILFTMFAAIMPKKTQKGAEAYWHILGFKEYIKTAEKYRLQFAEKENIFEKYLPYAIVFGLVDKWAKAFEGIYNNPPSWYEGHYSGVFTTAVFLNSFNGALLNMNGMAIAPGSRSGGSGFGGGGFSGGGGGGGGGGSW